MKSFKTYLSLQEARKNPDQNPKVSPYDYLVSRLQSTRGAKIEGNISNLFVSFTTLGKIGVNPRSKFNTPLGIYSYYAEYIVDEAEYEDKSVLGVDYATNSPYANVFEATSPAKVVNLTEMTPSQFDGWVRRLIRLYPDYEKAIITLKELSQLRSKVSVALPGGQFWFVTLQLAEAMVDQGGDEKSVRKPFLDKRRKTEIKIVNRRSVVWNKIFRDLGIDGCVDTGKGIIHKAEARQAVFFTKRAINKIVRLDNKWHEREIKAGIEKGQRNKEWYA